MRLSLIGMSGTGKSHWSKMLAECGFKCFCCDDLITERIGPALAGADGVMRDLGAWMGFPFDDGYEEREARYLELEIEVLSEVVEYLKGGDARDREVVVDTTGSVIYTGEGLLEELRRQTTIIHFSTSPEIREKMLEAYLVNRRPVLWRDMFSRKRGESNRQALARCYVDLLIDRERRYESLADVTIDYSTRARPGFGLPDFLDLVSGK